MGILFAVKQETASNNQMLLSPKREPVDELNNDDEVQMRYSWLKHIKPSLLAYHSLITDILCFIFTGKKNTWMETTSQW